MAYISQLDVSLNAAEETHLLEQKFKKIYVDLNKGAGGKSIYLWYKNGPEPITRVQVSFNKRMAEGLGKAGYKKIDKNLNAGAGGDIIYLWYYKGTTDYDTPIVGVDVTTDASTGAAKFQEGWERLACDLNRSTGEKWIHVWLKREKPTYISDVIATDGYGADVDKFNAGYIRVDETTNRWAGGDDVFIWYRQTTKPEAAIRYLQISVTSGEETQYQAQHYLQVPVDLNKGTGGNKVYLWSKKQGYSPPIKAIALLLEPTAVNEYEEAGLKVIEKNLNTGNSGSPEFLSYYQ